MKATALFLTLALIASSGTSAHATGVNLSWDDCGSFGHCNQEFACDANGPGVFMLVGSFVAPAGTNEIIGEEVSINLYSEPASVPDWWRFKNAGTCRMNDVSVSFDFTNGPYACTDYSAGRFMGGITAFSDNFYPGYPNNFARIRLLAVLPPGLATSLDEGTEYYSFKLSISKARTIGTGACGGCSTPMILFLNEIVLAQPAGVGNYRLQNPIHSNFVAWQNGSTVLGDVGLNCSYIVPTRNSTWGAIKSLYR